MRIHQKITFLFLIASILFGCAKKDQPRNNPNPLLLISFDGFRYDFLEKTETPYFDSLIQNGVKAESLIPVFPTKTFPNHYSIATGLYAENSGLVGNTMYDPEFGEWYRIRDRKAVENKKWYAGEPIWNTVEKQGLKAGTMFWVGSEANIQDMRPTHWKSFDGNMPYKARIDTMVKWLSYPGDRAIDFGTLYFELVDGVAHSYGLRSDSLKAAIRQADNLMGYLKKQLMGKNKWDDTNIIVLSDHGMTDLSAEKIIRLDSIINMQHVQRITWAPATMIQPKPGKKESLYQALKAAEKNYRVYKKEDLPERYHIKNNRRVPEIVMVADLGYTILNTDYENQFVQNLPAATHGYDNADQQMHAVFIAKGPAFKSGKVVAPFQNIHVYELMTYVLGIQPAPNDRSLDSVRVMLR